MRESILLQFPVSEYENRLAKLVKKMDEGGINAVIFTSDENTYYFSGFRSIVWASKVSTPGVLVVTRDGDMMIASSKNGRETVKVTSCVEDIRYYGVDSPYENYSDAILNIIREKKLEKGKIALELGTGHKMHLNHYDRTDLFKGLSDSEIVDCAGFVWDIRMIKSELEIEKLRTCCRINIEGMKKGFKELTEGMSELDLYRNIVQEYFRLGAEFTLPLGVRAGKERYSQGNSPPSERPIGKGEIILVDGGPVYKGYFSDIIREAVIGSPTAYQLDMFNAAREACYVGIDKVKPGVPINEVAEAVDEYMDNSRYAHINVYKNWCGHAIGVGVHEYPMLDIQTTTVLEPGMVFAIEPYFYEENVGSLGIEENILVTETGCDILTPLDSNLMIL